MSHPISRRAFIKLTGLNAASVALAPALGQMASLKPVPWQGNKLTYAGALSREVHLLNRVTWGVRDEDLAAIQKLGIEGYLDWQLQPDQIADPRVEAYLAKHPVLNADYAGVSRQADADYSSVYNPLVYGRLHRAAFSERGLFEHMVEFWHDHFNIPAQDLLNDKVIEDRDVIRKQALGTFREMVLATAQSLAMLRYLNQTDSVKEHPNENYARELMELHTLGINGGYTERDVKEVARALTGWRVLEGSVNQFQFVADDHDTAEKLVLGVTLPAGRGIEDGLDVLNLLCSHPSTARFISFKLCRRFVNDNPPASLIESTAKVFTETDGDIKAILRHILLSEEFYASAGTKFRRPLEFTVAIMRVMRAEVKEIWVPLSWAESMGQFPFNWHPPNGYPEVGRAWMNTTGLLGRWGAALGAGAAAGGWVEGFNVDAFKSRIPQDLNAEALVDATFAALLPQVEFNPTDRANLIAFIGGGLVPEAPITGDERNWRLAFLIGLIIASPYFQWR